MRRCKPAHRWQGSSWGGGRVACLLCRARQARRGAARLYMARIGCARQWSDVRVAVWQVRARQEWHGSDAKVRRSAARWGTEWHGKAGSARYSPVRSGAVRNGNAAARQERLGDSRRGLARSGEVRQGKAGSDR